MTKAANTDTVNAAGVFVLGSYLGLALAAILALLVAFVLLKTYRRAVLRAMRAPSGLQVTQFAPFEASTTTKQATQREPNPLVLDHYSAITSGKSADLVYADLLHAPWRTAAIYTVAGLCYAFIGSAILVPFIFAIVSSPIAVLSLIWPLVLLQFWILAWPIVLVIYLVTAGTWRAKLTAVTFYVLVFAAIGVVWVIRKLIPLGWDWMAWAWFINSLPATILIMIFLNRRIRAVGALVMILMVLLLTGPILAMFGPSLAVAVGGQELRHSISDLGSSFGLDSRGISIAILILGFASVGPLGWLTLQWIKGRYERKKLSDQILTFDAIWLIFSVVHGMNSINFITAFGSAGWILLSLLAFTVYKVTAWTGFSLQKRKSFAGESISLLLLRVFSLGRRSERLFDALVRHWRHVGDIRLIAGPDLATTTVEPHEFLDFLSGKLARRFIDSPKTLDLRISEMDLKPDRDGRFRVNDFFCYENTWRMTLSRLVADSDAVLMDLRGFSQENQGVAYEIEELINVVPLERVVFVIDETTDEQFLRQTVQGSWDRMKPSSPNRFSTPEQLQLFRFTGSHSGDLRHLLSVLSNAAKPGPVGGRDRLASV